MPVAEKRVDVVVEARAWRKSMRPRDESEVAKVAADPVDPLATAASLLGDQLLPRGARRREEAMTAQNV
jgi:hypothetical protein